MKRKELDLDRLVSLCEKQRTCGDLAREIGEGYQIVLRALRFLVVRRRLVRRWKGSLKEGKKGRFWYQIAPTKAEKGAYFGRMV